ncbi:hypothetical protein BU17DRAFT_64405 [Hysterangium stoloniferum]|nr:hypothetical protein BU17DRAFT_64405 [Hysterangium stoloniferum]
MDRILNKYDRNGVGGMPVSKSMRELYLGYDDAVAKALLGCFFSYITKFLLMSFDSKYVQNLKEWWSELNEPTGVNDWFKALLESEPSFKHEVWKFPICMALAHNPMFVLDERCHLEHWQRPNHGFGMTVEEQALFSNLDKESESYHPLALSTDNLGEEGDNNIGESNNNDREGENNLKDVILSTAQEDQHQGKQSGAGLPSTMPNVESGDAQEEQLLPEQFPGPDGDLQLLESHLGKRKWDLDPESELTALPDDDQSPEPFQKLWGLLPRPKVHPWKHFHPHTSYSVQKRVRLNWEPCSDMVEVSQIKSPVQMKSGQKNAIESYVFKTFVNDGNDVYQVIDAEYELEWFKGLEKDREIFQDLCNIAQPPQLYNPCTMSNSIPADCTCFPALWFKDVLSDEEELTPLSLKKLSLFCDRVIMIPNPDRRHDFFQDRVHKSFDIQQLALQQGVDIHMQCEVHALDRHNEIMISYDTLAGNHTMNGAMGFPQYAIRWRLCATEGAFSRAHIDARKFATWIHIVHGTKLWVVMSGDIAETSLRNLNYRKRKWTYYLLEPGDQLFMPAGTIHAVMTLNDSWVEGGHFYG